MHTKAELDRRLKLAGVQPLKKLGQNFLLNPQICERIVKAVESLNPALVVEIGPGLGALTDELLKIENSECVLIEIDSGLVNFWKSKMPKINILHGDALKISWDFLQKNQGASVIVSNLPYSIAASIVVEMSVIQQKPDFMIFMFQKEVAERIASKLSGEDYGMLSVMAQTFWKIETVVDAGPQDFFPVPNVGSRVLKFESKKENLDRKKYLSFVKMAFEQRRKKLSTNLLARYNKPQIQTAFETLGLKEMARAQELSVEQFKDLFGLLN